MSIPTVWPVDAPCNQRFATNKASYQPDGHTGMDFACPIGTPIRAAAAGTVLYADWAQGLGWPNPYYINPDFTPNDGVDQSAGIVVVIDHGPFVTVYAHLNQTGLNPGDKVALGETIGQVGTTGFSSGPHLHFEVLPDRWNVNAKYYGRVNPELYIGLAPVVADNERIVGPLGVNGRAGTTSGDPVVRTVVGGTKERFDRWRNGEVLSGIGVWFGDGGGWYWAGGFEDQGVHGLRDDNPAIVVAPQESLKPNQRVTVAGGAQRRSAPDKNSQAVGDRFGGDLILTFAGYVRGTDPYGDGNVVWYVGVSGGYFWSGAFTSTGTDGLSDLTAPTTPTTPPVVVPVVDVPYNFVLDFPTLNGIAVEYAPAHLTNVDVGNFPAKPGTAVCHWWNSLESAPVIQGVIAEFKRAESFKSAHFVVDEKRIAQMVSLADRAYHAGPGGNDWVGVEISPYATERTPGGEYTERAKKIQANVRALLTALRDRKGYKFGLTLHKDVPGAATSCSALDLRTFEIEAPVVVVPPVVVPPVVVPPAVGLFTNEQAGVLADFAKYLLTKKG